LPDKEFLDQMLYRYNGIPKSIMANRDIIGLFLPLLRADLAVVETYVYGEGEGLPCPISVFGGTQDKIANQADLEDWQAYTRQEFRLRMFEGDHFFLKSAQASLLEAIQQDLFAYCS
jgi:surfactin synthase thioesterase subunit